LTKNFRKLSGIPQRREKMPARPSSSAMVETIADYRLFGAERALNDFSSLKLSISTDIREPPKVSAEVNRSLSPSKRPTSTPTSGFVSVGKYRVLQSTTPQTKKKPRGGCRKVNLKEEDAADCIAFNTAQTPVSKRLAHFTTRPHYSGTVGGTSVQITRRSFVSTK
jgi:hypothetical protein